MSDDSDTPDDEPPANGTYEVGYGRPPKHGQIKPGEVRNPRGRQRGDKSFKREIRDMLAMPVPMQTKTGNRLKEVSISTRRASLMKLREKALKGDARALDRLMEFARQSDEDDGLVASTGTLLAEDEAILANAREHERQLLLTTPMFQAADSPAGAATATLEIGDDQ